MATSMTHKYIPRIEQTEENLFIEEYYSSTDTKIYIDDVEQSEIAYINYSLQEQLKPIYGYASRTFDDVAIGNRIVTGMFKVPIKNPEAQTPMETIIARSQNSTLDDYNENQQILMDAIDWITGENTQLTDIDAIITEDDTTFKYRQKLIALGYNLDTNSPEHVLRLQIQQFQKDYGLEANGRLTTSTQYMIDKALVNNSQATMHIPNNTKLYTKPMTSSGHRIVVDAQDVYIIDSTYDGWVHVRTAIDGWEGFIYLEEVEAA